MFPHVKSSDRISIILFVTLLSRPSNTMRISLDFFGSSSSVFLSDCYSYLSSVHPLLRPVFFLMNLRIPKSPTEYVFLSEQSLSTIPYPRISCYSTYPSTANLPSSSHRLIVSGCSTTILKCRTAHHCGTSVPPSLNMCRTGATIVELVWWNIARYFQSVGERSGKWHRYAPAPRLRHLSIIIIHLFPLRQ